MKKKRLKNESDQKISSSTINNYDNKAAEDMQQYAKICVDKEISTAKKQTMWYANSNKYSMS